MKKMSMPSKPIVPAGARWDEDVDVKLGIREGNIHPSGGLDGFKKKR